MRKFLFPLFMMAAVFVGVACTNSKAEADRTESQSVAPVIRVTPTPQAESISIAAVGDTMLGSTAQGRGVPVNDGAEMISGLTPVLSSVDIAFGNLEGAMIDGGVQTKCGPNAKFCYTFSMPTRYGKYLKEAGFDVVSLANNHS